MDLTERVALQFIALLFNTPATTGFFLGALGEDWLDITSSWVCGPKMHPLANFFRELADVLEQKGENNE